MTITRIGVEGGTGTGGQHLPFARAAGADGWLFVSGQTPMVGGEVVGHGIVEQTRQTLTNLLAILAEAGYGPEHVVRCGVWLDDPRDFHRSTRCSRTCSAPTRQHGRAWCRAW